MPSTPERHLELCPEDPSGHGLHWRNLDDPPETCRACGRGEVEPEGPLSHLSRAFGIKQGTGPHPKPQDRVRPTDRVVTPSRPVTRADAVPVQPRGEVDALTEALDRVASGTEREWANAVLQIIHRTAETTAEFTTDAIWSQVTWRPRDLEERAMGPLMIQARKEGWIASTERYIRTERSEGHRNPKRVWRSLLL